MGKHRVLTTDKAIEETIASVKEESRVDEVRFEEMNGEKMLGLIMSDGSRHYFPKARLQGLSDVPDQDVSNFEITPEGLGIHWPAHDVDLYVPSLLEGVYGTKQWMTALGRRGGSVKSDAKSRAARENGCKGGRPRGASRESDESENAVRKLHIFRAKNRFSFEYRPVLEYARLFGDKVEPRELPRIC